MSTKLEKEIKRAVKICNDMAGETSWEEIEASYKFLIKHKIVKLVDKSFYIHRDHVFLGALCEEEFVFFGFNGMNFKF